ncbi:prolipoprotein diacylglyceryl transferase [Fructilactobacillus myrtifloralis]|uniref:Phosphatidylglycerol--prolipoprotein diacylglyceryl transferase n=1 Tax=Fructilactobacillus myrtifloralis TaxID=2940301 RepID=A0ABY5BMP9_9LACO|nr:prolipoprotein diacylglyceryl transferase [Fructilactobacillus myrtifloralis]USS84958.1 prolipoprotein diacylglyceryl transferase [Fructilactobacillus myrtifloralis]
MFVIGALNPIALQFGPLTVRWYGLIIASAVLIAVGLAMREVRRQGLNEDVVYNLILGAIPVAIVSARLYYVVFRWDYYAKHPGEIIAIWDGGIAIYGALLGAGLFIWWFCRRHGLSLWQVFDIAAPTVIMAQGIGRWGNFMNQEAYGAVTTHHFLAQLHLPTWMMQQMLIGGAYRQPTFLYESVWDLVGFALLMTMRHAPRCFKRGELFLTYVMWYSYGRFFTEGMRTDSLMLGPWRISQVLSVLLCVGAMLTIIYRRRHDANLPWYDVVNAKGDS